MSFLRKKTDYEDDEELEERSRYRRPRSKEFKDLKPENKKRRKEPPKPWGKKERILILIGLVLTIGTSGILALSSRSWKLAGFPRFKLPSLSLPEFLKEETIVLEDDNSEIRNRKKAQEVTNSFKEKVKDLTGVYGLYISELNNNFSYGVNEKEIFQAASLIKLPVIATMFAEAESGNINLDEKYSLKNSDKIGGSGSLSSKPSGYELTYRELIHLMGNQSDNTAFNICRRAWGDEKIEEMIKKIGMTNTSLEKNETTPEDIGVFFEKMWKGDVVTRRHVDEILGYLTNTIYEDHIAAGIPDDVRIAHKYGREIHVVNDAGIVFTRDPFVLVILSRGVVEKEADSVFPELAKMILDLEN